MSTDVTGLLKQNPLRVVCGVLALLSAVGVYFVNAKIADTISVVEQRAVEGGRLAENIKNATLLPEQLEAVVSANKKIQSRLVHAGQLATNLQYFYRLETESGVELVDLRQTTSGQTAKPNAGVGFSISVKGDYAALLGCLRRLENGPHFCRVLSASIGAATDRSAPLTLSLSLELFGQP